ncbi:MAG: hypothetical protein QF662_04110, partial [Phycisphaerae bacterium]|nr:hypothetical protein [Phycisphaerae bacterium]
MKNGTKAHFAVLTPPGRGGIAVIRVQGPAAIQALGEIFRPSKKDLTRFQPGRIYYGHIHDANGRVLDEVIVSITNASAPAEALDINCHGGSAAVQAVGARLAELGIERRSADDLNALAGIDPITRAAMRLLPVQAT